MASAEGAGPIDIEVAWSPREREVQGVALRLPSGATVLQALRQSGLFDDASLGDPSSLRVGVWGERRALDSPLRDRDRVEVYRPLLVEPMEARRRRQQAKAAKKR
jgi:putative ubiquitin-RnfH superfamily antitoxin RatB of RatAB toxin-antitoxin module